MTADYSFLSYYPYYGFQGLTSHYANPLGGVRQACRGHRVLGRPRRPPTSCVKALDTLPWPAPTVFLMRRGGAASDEHLHPAAGRGRLPQPAQRAPLRRRARRRSVHRTALHRQDHRPVRLGRAGIRSDGLARPITIYPRDQTRANYRTARLVALVAGLLGAALAILTPLLPVKQTTAQLSWPQNGDVEQRHRPADRLRRHRSDHHHAVPGRAGLDCSTRPPGQDGAAVHGAQAGAQGRRPGPADPARQRRPGGRRPQHPGRRRAAEPGAQPGLPEADLHRPRRQGDRRVRRPDQGRGQRRPRRTPARGTRRLRLPTADRRGLHRPVRSGPAGAELLGDRRHPLQQGPHAAEDGRDGARRAAAPSSR